MPRSERAKQFAPFDALKGLHDALRLKEYEHDAVQKGEISEEEALKISNTLSQIKRGDIVQVKYYSDGHYHDVKGRCELLLDENILKLDKINIPIMEIFDIMLMKNQQD